VDKNGRYLPPFLYLRKQVISKLAIYGVNEEEGEYSGLRKHIFRRYRMAIRNLWKKLEIEK